MVIYNRETVFVLYIRAREEDEVIQEEEKIYKVREI